MLATFIIGLREGLEAALIVGIIATFLRRSGKGLTAMWLGVAAAVVLSLAVGLGLALVERSLPQAAQEGMEAVIGAVAVIFVTGMIFWMNAHARDMKRQLEAEAAEALGRASGFALAVMAFLAVLKEGFETSVFLLATFSVASSAILAALGALIGLLVAVLLGWGIYAGGVRIDLSRFFRVTGAFLILLAAGLVVSSLRTAHEAGWLNAGQALALDLSWLVAPGTIRSALVTGVLGIPRDPRVVEVVGWFAYLVPVSALVYWPASIRSGAVSAARLKLAAAGALAALALGLALAYPQPSMPAQGALALAAPGDAEARVGVATLATESGNAPSDLVLRIDGQPETRLPLTGGGSAIERHLGIEATAFELTERTRPAATPQNLSLSEVAQLSGGRLPRGVNPASHPGPFQAAWTVDTVSRVWIADDRLLDARQDATAVVTLSGGGLGTSRTFRVAASDAFSLLRGWEVAPAAREAAAGALKRVELAGIERRFWAGQLPIGLLALAIILAAAGARTLAAARPASPSGFRPRPIAHS